LFFAIALPCLAELTQQDLEKIGNLIDRKLEPVKIDVAEMKGKMATKDDIAKMERQISKIEGRMTAMATKEEINTLMCDIFSAFFIIWIIIFAAIITIPYLCSRADRKRAKRLEAEVRELEKLKSEVEALKAIRGAEEKRKEIARKIAEEKPEFAEAYRMIGLL